MKKAELMQLVGKKVFIFFKDGGFDMGTLGYASEFSAKHDFLKPNHFYIADYSFKVSHVKKVVKMEA